MKWLIIQTYWFLVILQMKSSHILGSQRQRISHRDLSKAVYKIIDHLENPLNRLERQVTALIEKESPLTKAVNKLVKHLQNPLNRLERRVTGITDLFKTENPLAIISTQLKQVAIRLMGEEFMKKAELKGGYNGYWWPLYVPDWYCPRVSNHFFDPYSFMHITHGFLFYSLWGWWPELIWGYEETRWWVWVGGPILAFFAESAYEYTENTSWMIQLYRQNSGTSALYEGDSWQNIVGDLIASTFGWYVMSHACHFQVCRYVIPIWLLLTEIGLILYMRDSPALTLLQLFAPVEAIKKWQAENLPTALDIEDDGDDEKTMRLKACRPRKDSSSSSDEDDKVPVKKSRRKRAFSSPSPVKNRKKKRSSSRDGKISSSGSGKKQISESRDTKKKKSRKNKKSADHNKSHDRSGNTKKSRNRSANANKSHDPSDDAKKPSDRSSSRSKKRRKR